MGDIAVITGVSRGIGRACALMLADRGLDLALLGRPSEAHDSAQRECASRGVNAHSIACDMTSSESIEHAAQRILNELGTPRIVINNAAILERGPRIHELPVESWDRVLCTNLRGPFILCRSLLPAMLKRGRGRFLHIASISATIANPQAAAYGASKWGLVGFSKSLAEELRDTGLQSIAILPGSVDTDMLKETPFTPDMSPEDVATLIVYNALDAPDAVNGASVEIFG